MNHQLAGSDSSHGGLGTLGRQTGAAATEYALVLALVLVATLTALGALGVALNNRLEQIVQAISG